MVKNCENDAVRRPWMKHVVQCALKHGSLQRQQCRVRNPHSLSLILQSLNPFDKQSH